MRPLAENACLALVAEGLHHGWAIGGALAPDGRLGRIWSLSRPLTYRAIDALVEGGLVARTGSGAGRGRRRSLLRITARGRRALSTWLDEPVEHIRDVRTELLLKLELRQRAGLDTAPLAEAQRARFAELFASLTSGGHGGDLVDLWRRESARGVRRFLDAVADPDRVTEPGARPSQMRLSARNQLTATAIAVTHGDVMTTIKVALPDGQHLTSAITRDAAEELDLAAGDPVLVVVKSTEVMIAVPS